MEDQKCEKQVFEASTEELLDEISRRTDVFCFYAAKYLDKGRVNQWSNIHGSEMHVLGAAHMIKTMADLYVAHGMYERFKERKDDGE